MTEDHLIQRLQNKLTLLEFDIALLDISMVKDLIPVDLSH
jgi:hypothetical protein